MTLEIDIYFDKCEPIKEGSVYNHNFYRLPIFINNCNILLEICREDENEYEYYLVVDINDESTWIPWACDYGFNICKDRIVLDTKLFNKYNT